MSASVIISIVVLILIFSFMALFAVIVSKAIRDAFSLINSMHKRMGEQQDRTLDRLHALDWESLAGLRAMEDPQDGGFFAPGEQEEAAVKLEPPPRWGALSSLRDHMSDTERELLEEDFDEMAAEEG